MSDINIISDEQVPEFSDEIPQDDILQNKELQLNHKNVLVVEDSDDSREMLCHILKKAGANVDSAINGKEGLEKALKNKPDLLLLDLEMPEMDGFHVINQLRTQQYKKTIVAITSHNTIHDKDRCHAAGFDGFISKPFDPEKLLRVVKEHLYSV